MNLHVSYKACKTPDIENQINTQTEKLRKRLQVFRPDLIHLHAALDQNSAREGFSVSLNLRLPSGQMASSGVAPNCVAALKIAFDDLLEQVSKHKARLRERYKAAPLHARRGGLPPASQVPFEETVAAVKLPTISALDVNSWVGANLNRLVRFADRELRYREANGGLRPGQITREEVIDETIANALSDPGEKPERVALEPWLYRLARRSIDDLAEHSRDLDAGVPLRQYTGATNVEASDEARLQWNQPDEALLEQDNIPDRNVATPEEIAYSDEMNTLVETALQGARREDREAFLLYAIEGFTPDEIALVSDREAAAVRTSILAAREHLRRALPLAGEFEEKLRAQAASARPQPPASPAASPADTPTDKMERAG